MQLKSAAKLSTMTGLITKHARHTISVQRPLTTTAFAQRPLCVLCAPAELLLRCRRPYCAVMATLQRPHCTLIRTPSDGNRSALVLSMLVKKCAPSLRRCLRSYCTHLGVLHFSRTLWERCGNAVRTSLWCDSGFITKS